MTEELEQLIDQYERVRTQRTPERARLLRALTIELRHSYANKGVAFVRNGILYWIDSLGELMRMPAKRTRFPQMARHGNASRAAS